MTYQSWAKEVDADQLNAETEYFLAIKRSVGTHFETYDFYAKNIKGKMIISEKPGIAVRVLGNEKLVKILSEHPDHVALAIPADAATRWKRRQKPGLRNRS